MPIAMRLQDIPPPTHIRAVPPERDEPAKEWRVALDSGLLPKAVVDFYEITKFLSASKLAGFGDEGQRVVSVYINRVFGSLRECILEANDQAAEYRKHLPHRYDPTKSARDEAAEERARRGSRAAFRLFMIDIFGAFDAIADLIAIMLPGELAKLQVGRGMFTKHVYDWAARQLPTARLIVSPAQPFVEQLHDFLRSRLVTDAMGGPWFDLLRFYRNKVTHLGHQTWQEYGLQASDGQIYFFLPRSWPSIPERHYRPPNQNTQPSRPWLEQMEEMLVHVDVLPFVGETYEHSLVVIDGAVRILYDAYRALGIRQVAELAASLREVEISAFTSF